MSEKRWALKEGKVVPALGGDRFCGRDDFEEVHTYDPATESAVPHEALHNWARWFYVGVPTSRLSPVNDPATYLPKQKPTLREALRSDGYGDAWINELALRCGIDPDKRMED